VILFIVLVAGLLVSVSFNIYLAIYNSQTVQGISLFENIVSYAEGCSGKEYVVNVNGEKVLLNVTTTASKCLSSANSTNSTYLANSTY